MSRELKGEDLSLTVTMGGEIQAALGVGIENFTANPITVKIDANNLDGRRLGQTFQGWKGTFNLNLRNTAALTFMDAYLAILAEGGDPRVTIRQGVVDRTLGVRRYWTYRLCVLDFNEGEYSRTNPAKLRIEFETGERRIPG